MANYRSQGYAGKLGWSVGIHTWLDREDSKVARYWRVIEFGSAATRWPWQGQTIVGLWGPNAEPRGGLIRDGLSPFGERRDQKFVPFFSRIGAGPLELEQAGRAALWALTRGGTDLSMFKPRRNTHQRKGAQNERKKIFFYMMNKATLEEMPFVSGVIQKEVPAANFYTKAMLSFDPMAREMELLRQELSESGIGLDITTPGGLKEVRIANAAEGGNKPRRGRRGNEGGARHVDHVGIGASTGPAMPIVNGPLISVDASVHVRDFIRDGSGRFSAEFFTQMIYRINRRVAAEYQAEVVRLMRQERKRPPTGNLIKATESRNNRIPH